MVMTIVLTAVPNWSGMNDLINRQNAINELYNINPSEDMLFVDAIVDMLENLPEKSEQKWIPVTEALPEENKRVLVTVKRFDGEKRVHSGSYFKKCFWIDSGDFWKCKDVLAWMLLPEPWESNNG